MNIEELGRAVVENALKLQEVAKKQDVDFAEKNMNFNKSCEVKLLELNRIGAQIVQDSQIEAKKIVDAARYDQKILASEIYKWEIEKSLIAQVQKFDTTSIKLDIGGNVYGTTLATLCRFPETMIGAMFSGRHALNKNENGAVFIDRDGTHFRHILNFLRNPDDYTVDLSAAHMAELRREAKFHGLDELMFPFTPAADATVQATNGYSTIICQDSEGLWKSKESSNATMVLVTVCSCGAGSCVATHNRKVTKSYIDGFTATREIVNAAQPKYTFTNPCPRCSYY